MGEHTPADAVEIKVKDDEIIEIDNLKIKSLYTPGHTSDSYSFLLDNYLFSGDTLLINGTGRTDFQNGSSKDAYNSLFNNLLKLPEETLFILVMIIMVNFQVQLEMKKNLILDYR